MDLNPGVCVWNSGVDSLVRGDSDVRGNSGEDSPVRGDSDVRERINGDSLRGTYMVGF